MISCDTLPEIDVLDRIFAQQRAAMLEHPFPDLNIRLDRLRRVQNMLDEYEDRFIQAVSDDFGQRSKIDAQLADVLPVRLALQMALKKLRKWMKPRRVSTHVLFQPGRSRIMPQPLGVVGVISPWNFPIQLTLSAMVTALAAGNRVILKPSELTPKFAHILQDAVSKHFCDDVCAVVVGEVEVSKHLTSLPFDHIIFTGSTSVGRLVAQSAAKNLTPVTLELGGKSPVIIDESAHLDQALRRILKGKLMNAGQICVAPDYLIVPKRQVDEIAARAIEIAEEMFPILEKNPDVTSIVSKGHYDRIQSLVTDATAKGAVVHVSHKGMTMPDRVIPLTVLTNVSDDMQVMQDEIFGPVLPILPTTSQQDTIQIVQSRSRPLALYWFGNDVGRRDEILHKIHSGGVTINDTLLHLVQDNLPFGGVGDSGMGNYHGKAGFERLSHLKAIFTQSRVSVSDMLTAPFGGIKKRLVNITMWLGSR